MRTCLVFPRTTSHAHILVWFQVYSLLSAITLLLLNIPLLDKVLTFDILSEYLLGGKSSNACQICGLATTRQSHTNF